MKQSGIKPHFYTQSYPQASVMDGVRKATVREKTVAGGSRSRYQGHNLLKIFILGAVRYTITPWANPTQGLQYPAFAARESVIFPEI